MRTIQANQPGSPNRSTCIDCGCDTASFEVRCRDCKRVELIAKMGQSRRKQKEI